MNSQIDQFIEAIAKKLPDNELLTSSHLVSIGIAKSVSTLNRWRQKYSGPPFLRISKGQIRYPKQPFLDWLRQTHQPMFPFMYAPFKEAESCEVTNES